MEKHKPLRELPEDIKQLAHEETVCRFCGVSYLVHHEISKLEDRVELLQEEVKRLNDIEKEKTLWAVERNQLGDVLKRTHDEQSVLQGKLDSKEAELCVVKSKYETAQQEWEKQTADTLTTRCQIVEHLYKFKEELSQLRQFRVEVNQLLLGESLSLAELKRKGLRRCSSFEEQIGRVHLQLATENKKLQVDLKCQVEEGKELKQLLNERQDLCQKYKVQVQGFLKTIENQKTELVSKDNNISSLLQELSLSKYTAQELECDLKACIEEKDLVIRGTSTLQDELKEIKITRESVQKETKLELMTLKQKFTIEEKGLRHSLENCQQELSRSLEANRLLRLEHAQHLETMTKEKFNFENMKHDLIEDHKKVLHDAAVTNRAALHDMQAKMTQIKSVQAASELEKTRLISSLTEQLRKEKDIADREFTDHLNTVKTLELSLLQEKRAKKEMEERFSTKLDELQQVRESSVSVERQNQSLKERLAEAYREISTLQAIVERECEEREKFIEKLSMTKARKSDKI